MQPSQLMKVLNCSYAFATQWCLHLNSAMEKVGINKPIDQAMFLAQISHESRNLTNLKELFNFSSAELRAEFGKYLSEGEILDWSYTKDAHRVPIISQMAIANKVYGGRLGNTVPGDGWTYRGRGPIMLKGKANYTRVSQLINVDLISNPDLLMMPHTGMLASAHYYVDSGCLAYSNNIVDVTTIIKGSINGLANRKILFEHFKRVMEVKYP